MLKFDWNFLFVIINLVIFYFLMKKFIFGKIMATMDKRKELIKKQFDEADEAKADAEKLRSDYQAQLDDVENERKELIGKAKADAKKEYDKILDKASADASRVKSEAKRAAELELQQARANANDELVALAMETAEKVIGENASADIDKKLYDKFLQESSEE